MESIYKEKNNWEPSVLEYPKGWGLVVFLNLCSVLWLLAGGQLFLFISRTQGFWFDRMYGIITGILGIISILTTIVLLSKQPIKINKLCFFMFFILSLMIPLVFSKKVVVADSDAIRKAFTLLPYVIVPSLWGLIIPKNIFKWKHIVGFSFGLLAIGNIFLYRYYSEIAFSHFRAGGEANPIGLSYAFANLWIVLLSFILVKGRSLLFIILAAVAVINVFVLSTRQTLIYISFIIILLFFFYIVPFVIKKKERVKVYVSKRRLWQLLYAILFAAALVFTMQLFFNALNPDGVIRNSLNTALSRWSAFIDSGYVDEARKDLFESAKTVWIENPIIGLFSYHAPGSYAHHMLMDWLAEYGLVGAVTYLIYTILSIINIVKRPKMDGLDLCFSIMFIGLLSIGMLVTQLTTDPTFHFLLFYWVAPKKAYPLSVQKTIRI